MSRIKVVSYSEVDTYRQCRLKHQLSYQERWRAEEEAEALTRGTLWHTIMEIHYSACKARREGDRRAFGRSKEQIMRLLYDPVTGAQSEMQELLEWMYRGYVELYGADPEWEVVAIEQRFEVWLPTARGTRSTFKLAGTADLIVRDFSAGGGLWIVDHKTCKNLPKGKDLDMEDQTGIYTWLMRQGLGLDIRGAIYNFARTQKLKTREMGMDERFKRPLTVRVDKELDTMVGEIYQLMREAYGPRETEFAPRSPDGERCGWKCSFTEPCLAARKGADLRMMMEEFGFSVHDTKPGPTFNKEKEPSVV